MNTADLTGILKRKEIPAFIIAFCCTYILFPAFFECSYYPLPGSGPSWLSLDPSWQVTLGKINFENLNWGKDFAFTYGPLSYLATRVGWGVSKIDFVLFDLFMSFNFFYVFYTSYLRSNEKKTTTLLIIIATFLLPVYFGSGNALILTAFLVFWIRKSLDEGKPFFYLMQIILVVLLFFIKFNTGLVSFIFFSAGIIYKLFFTKDKKVLVVTYFLTPLLLIFLLSFSLNVSLPEYLKGGLEIVTGYNEVMYLNENYINEFRFSLVIILLAVFILLLKLWIERIQFFKNFVVFFLFSSIVYVLYKQAFTRADIQHIQEFYKYVLLLILCVQDFHFNQVGKNSINILVAIVFITVFFTKKREDHIFRVMERVTKTDYVNGFKSFTETSGMHLFPNDNQIPQGIKDRIGKNTVDVYPWNSYLLFENDLNFTPRPAFQSYTAYTPYLENLNFEFYSSPRAPQFVIYEFDAIDGRYPLFDEPKLNLVLLKQYSCVDTFRYADRLHLLLQKNKSASKKISFQKVKEYEMPLTGFLAPEPGKYYELFVSNTLKGKLRSFLYQSPRLTLTVKTRDGVQHEYRTSKKLMETGIFSGHFFNSTSNFYNFIRNDSLGTLSDVEGYYLIPYNPALFKDKMRVVEYIIN